MSVSLMESKNFHHQLSTNQNLNKQIYPIEKCRDMSEDRLPVEIWRHLAIYEPRSAFHVNSTVFLLALVLCLLVPTQAACYEPATCSGWSSLLLL